jgi:hypothetical protein
VTEPRIFGNGVGKQEQANNYKRFVTSTRMASLEAELETAALLRCLAAQNLAS